MAFKGTKDGAAEHGWNTPDHSRFDLPNSNWTLGFWARIASGETSGSAAQYIFSHGTYQTNNSFNVLLYDDTHGVTPDRWEFTINTLSRDSSPATQDDGTWKLYLVEFVPAETTVRMRRCPKEGAIETLISDTGTSNLGVTCTSQVSIARRNYTNDRNCGFSIAEVFLATDLLTDAEIVAMATGKDVTDYISSANLRFYSKFRTVGASGDYTDDDEGFTWTRTGTITEVNHPYPSIGFEEGTHRVNITSARVNDTNQQVNDTNIAALPALAFTADETEGENVNVNTSVIQDPSTATPTVTLVPYLTTTDNGWGDSFWFFMKSFTNAGGKTVTFQIDDTEFYDLPAGSWQNLNMVYSEDGKPVSDRTKFWEYFDNRVVVGTTPKTLRCWNNAPFVGSLIHVAYARPVMWSMLDDYLDNDWDFSPYVQEPASAQAFGGNKYDIATVASELDINGRLFPVQTQRAFEITALGETPVDGGPKKVCLLISGMHSPEDMGTEGWIRAVEFLLAANEFGNNDEKAAWRLIKEFVFWCCAWTSPGRYFHHDRGYHTAAVGAQADDPNRVWDGVPALPFITAVRDAFLSDHSSVCDVAIDFHTQGTPDNDLYMQSSGNSPTYHSRIYRTKVQQYGTFNLKESDWDGPSNQGSTQEYTAETLKADVSITFEQGEQTGEQSVAVVTADARAIVRGLDDMIPILSREGLGVSFGVTSSSEVTGATQIDVDCVIGFQVGVASTRQISYVAVTTLSMGMGMVAAAPEGAEGGIGVDVGLGLSSSSSLRWIPEPELDVPVWVPEDVAV